MSKYIIQNMTKYNNIKHFSETFNEGYTSYFDKEKSTPSFTEVYNSKYLIVVAEPGYGKTRLFKELVLQANENSFKVFFIDAKQIKNSIIESINKCKIIEENISEEKLQKKIYFCNQENYTLDDKTIICLDALDELPFLNLYSFLEQVEEFIADNPSVKVFLSCRTHHLNKIEYDLSNILFEYISLDKFYGKQVFNYLESRNINKKTINEIEKKSKLGNLFEFLEVPRYLYYFSELIQNKNINEIINLSRVEIFEHFIYRKIDKERDKKYPESENHTIKRVLEELALVMKIFQVSLISKDDFFTVFKELNLGNIFTGKGLIEKLCDKSLLKDNIDYLEFENQEFLDFLASKELSRFEKIEQVFFDIAVEPHLKEVYTSWFYVMPFVLEQNPNMINIILDFLEKNSNKILREEYFEVLVNIDTKFLDEELRLRIFNLVFDYSMEHNQWIYHYANKLIYFYDEKEHYQKIIDSINGDVETNNIKIRNVIDIINNLSKKELLNSPQIEFWKDKFLEWLKLDVKKFKNLHRAIISSSVTIMKNDFDWIKSIYFIFETGIDVQHEYSRACYKIAPNNSFSIDIYFKCDDQFEKNKIDSVGRLDDNVKYISKVNSLDGIKYILEKLTSSNSKEYLRYIFSNSYRSKFQDDLKQFILNIRNNLNDEIIELLKTLLIELIKLKIRHEEHSKYLFQQIFKILIEKETNFLILFIDELYKETLISEYQTNSFGSALELEHGYSNVLALELTQIDYDIEEDKKLLEIALDLRNKGKHVNGYFFEEIVFRHIKYLNHKKTFEPLIEIEKFLQEKSSHKNLYSFEYKFKELKQIYLDNLSKPKHIMEAIKAYKKSKENEYITINSSIHLLEIVKDSISNEIKSWIEVEGAYKHIGDLAKKTTNTNAEDFIQKTIKTQIELALVKKGLRHTDIKIKREEQTLDDKRADFTINYGFIGQVLLELKLSHNSESKVNQKNGKDYKEKLIKYIDATNSNYGLFIIFNTQENKIVFERQIEELAKFYEDKENIFILGLNCFL